jgi:uncharacterized tellurite resistance protein B-like protein
LTFGTEEALLGGVTPRFVVDVSASGGANRSGGNASSIDELASALREAATYKSPVTLILVGAAVAALLGIAIEPLLLIAVVIATIALLFWATARTARRRRVSVLYRLDDRAARTFDSLVNGIGWLGSSRALWRVVHETRVGAHASRGEVANLLTNIGVPSIAAAGEALHFLPDALVIRDYALNFVAMPYASIGVGCETTRFSESQSVPADSQCVGQTWVFANKNGSPDRRRANNRQIPVLEYARITLSWGRSGCVLLVSNVQAARHFANALQAMTQPIRKAPEVTMQRPEPAVPTDLERALQASIDRKRRLEELEREAAAVVARPEPPPANAEWVAPGYSTTVHGFATGDFVYVGRSGRALDGSGVEPSLIDPARPIDPSYANTSGAGMTYWPSYSGIPPASRRAYLQWLAGGRKDPNAYIGYVFIFFYGLERRVYEFMKNRGSSADEVLAIGREVARLLDLYAEKSGSFASYGESFLDLIASIESRARDLRREPVRPGYGVPHRLKIALGECARDVRPVPANLALDWVRSSYDLNTPASRCAEEFELLFHVRYAKQFGDGAVVKPNNRVLDLTYRPASSALEAVATTDRKIPDVTQLTRPLDKLIELARECSSALDPFSRFLGKNPYGRQSLSAFALLPEELVEGTPSADAQSLASLVRSRLDGDGRAHLSASELLQYVALAKPDKVSKNEAMLLAQALEKLGYGIEPDVRLGGSSFEQGDPAVVFRRLPDCPSAASDDYTTATLCMRLGAIVSAADDEVSELERALLRKHIEETLQLSPGERQRLGAHLSWLLDAKPGTTGLKKRLAALTTTVRHHIAGLLVTIAATDGHVDPREMKILEKLFDLLELPAADLYRDVHALQADDEPVVVDQPPATTKKGFAIPPKPAPATTVSGIDMDRVRLKIAETRQVSTLLSSIFVEEEGPVTAAPAIAQAGTIGTLDAAHSELLRRLASRASWPRAEVERVAAELSLLTDGALETLNDYAYAAAADAFWEDDDPVAINPNVARELIA